MKHQPSVYALRSLLCAGAVLSLAVSCSKDSDYDALTESDGIDLTVHVASQGLTLPFGSTDRIYLTELLDTADVDVLHSAPDGLFYIEQRGNVDPTTFRVDPVTLNIDPDIEAKNFNLQITQLPADVQSFIDNEATALGINDLSVLATFRPDLATFPVQMVSESIRFEGSQFDIHVAGVDGLKQINSVALDRDVDLNLVFAINLPASTTPYSIQMSDITLQMPAYVILDGETPATLGRYTIADQTISVGAGQTRATWQHTIKAKGFDFARTGSPIVNTGNINVTGSINVTGEIRIEGYTLHCSEVALTGGPHPKQDLNVVPEMNVAPIVARRIVGLFNPAIDPVTASVDINLGDDLDILNDDNAVLVFDDPQLQFTLHNTSTLPIRSDLVLVADNGKAITFTGVDLQMAEGQTTKTLLFTRPGRGGDYTNDDLATFLSPVPDHIDVTINASVVDTEAASFTLGQDIRIGGDYAVNVPLQFERLSIRHEELIEDLWGEGDDAKDVTDVLPTISDAQLTFDVTSTVPIGLTISLQANNADGNRQQGLIQANTASIQAGSLQNPVASTVNLTVSIPATANVRDLVLLISGNGNNARLDAAEYIKLDNIKLHLENQKLDFNDKD